MPGLPRVQTIVRECEAVGCNVELTCSFLLDCFADATEALGLTFPVTSEDPRAAEAAYQCLKSFSAAVRSAGTHHQSRYHEATSGYNATAPRTLSADEEERMQKEMMVFDAKGFAPVDDLGPRVYQSSTLTYRMFGWRGPLWMTQTCNDGSGCPFVQGATGGGTTEQINAIIWASYRLPGESLEDFTEQMRLGARAWQSAMGGQRPWLAVPDMSRVYNVYNDADPWTAPGISRHMPAGRNLTYDLGGGGLSHCVYNADRAQESIRLWSTPVAAARRSELSDEATVMLKHDDDDPGWTTVTIDNTIPRRDTHGNILNAHDGHVFQRNGSFYLVGTSYTNCFMNQSNSCLGGNGNLYPQDPIHILNAPACGWTNNDLALYRSSDLMSWDLLNPSLLPADQRPNGIYFRPKMIFNALTNRFVLWFNYVTEGNCTEGVRTWAQNASHEVNISSWESIPSDGIGLCHSTCESIFRCRNFNCARNIHVAIVCVLCADGTAVSDVIDGPFKLHTLPVTMGASKLSPSGHQHGDFGLHVDDDGSAYIVYNSYDAGGNNVVDRLTSDFTASSGANSGYLPQTGGSSGEAQAMVKR